MSQATTEPEYEDHGLDDGEDDDLDADDDDESAADG
jgi:hypothetical protein